MLKSNVAFFVYIKKLNKCNITAVIEAGRGVTPGLTWCHPYFYFLFFCCFIPASPPCCTYNLCTGSYTVQRVRIHANVHAQVKQQVMWHTQLPCDAFSFFFSFWSYAYCGMSVTVLITIMGCHTGVGGGRLHGNPGC